MCVSLRGLAGPTALEAVHEAEAKTAAGDFVGAAAKYREAYAADSKPEYLCDVGVAYNKAKTELPRAHLFLSRCIERSSVLDPKYVASVHAAIAKIEASLRAGNYTPVDISVEQNVRVEVSAFAADEAFVGPRAIWLPYGTHRLTFSADGFTTETRDVEATASKRMSVSVTLQRTPIETVPIDAGSETPDAGVAIGSAGSGSPSVVPPVTPIEHRPSKLPAIATSAVSVGLLAVAAVTYRNAHDRADIAGLGLDGDTLQADKDYVSRQNTYMIATASLGLVGAGVSAYLWYRALHSPATHVEVNATGSGASVSVGGRF
jgi:hypothetical protein